MGKNIRAPTVRKSKLLIVDLAGSERVDKSGNARGRHSSFFLDVISVVTVYRYTCLSPADSSRGFCLTGLNVR